MKLTRSLTALGLFVFVAGAVLLAEEGMWRLDQVPLQTLSEEHGVRLSEEDLERVRGATVRILSGGGGGTGTFASANGLILTNHHVALDCIRTSTLAEQKSEEAENLIRDGFTASSPGEELPCRRFRVQVERDAKDVTAELEAVVAPDMDARQIQMARERARSDIERACQKEKGDNFRCEVVDFNSGARSLLITYEEYLDVRLVYAPENQLGFFGGDEMNFRFPRYVSDISILRAYQGEGGPHGEYDPAHVPVRPGRYLPVTFDGVNEGDFTLVAGFPGNTNRYRMHFSAQYNLKKGIPDQIRDIETELELLRKYADLKEDYEVLLHNRIFGLANALKYQKDVLAALEETSVVEDRRRREREFMAYLEKNPDLKKDYGDVLDAQQKVYVDDVAANDALDDALRWLQRSEILGYAAGLYEFALERTKSSDQEREPQFQERNWPRVRQALLNDDPIIMELEEDVLTLGFEKALALEGAQRIGAVDELRKKARSRAGSDNEAGPRELARAVLEGTEIAALEAREKWVEASVSSLEASTDPMLVFARWLEPSLKDQRQRIRVLNEKLFINRAKFARGMVAWKGDALYSDANFTLRASLGRVIGYTSRQGEQVPWVTRFGGLFELSEERGASGDFAIPTKLAAWREALDEGSFRQEYASLPMNFVSTHDITGGSSGSAVLDGRLRIVGLVFDGNQEAMANDWTYSERSARAISTDIRFALTVAREVHEAGWIVDELMNPERALSSEDSMP